MPKPYASTVVDASADDVWDFLRDFSAIADWHPAIDTCEIEDGRSPDQVGCIRRLTGPGDAVFRERLLALDDAARSCTYEFLASPFPVRGYRATFRVAPVTDTGRAFVEWWAWFECEAADEQSMMKIFAGAVFGAGLRAVAEHFAT